jgi:hypothetical protein
MYRRSDDKLLRTKIVATLGAPRNRVFDPKGRLIRKFGGRKHFWDRFLNWFYEDSMYLIDVIRLNMAFFKPPGRNERLC